MFFQRWLKMRRPNGRDAQDPAVLGRVARESDNTAARRDACRHLTSLEDLRDISQSDPDAGIRDVALARYRHLLCEEGNVPLSLEARLTELSRTDDPRTLAQVAVQAVSADLRRAAIERLTDAQTLAACALQDPLSRNRCAAVSRLSDKAALEQVVKKIGKKDKGVYRLARRQLKEITEQEGLPERRRAQCEELCGRIERLGRFGQWEQDRGLLDVIDREWSDLVSELPAEHRTRYEEGRERFLAAYAAHRQESAAHLAAEQALVERRAALEAVLEELARAEDVDDEAALEDLRQRATQLWSEPPHLPATESEALRGRYRDALAVLDDHLGRLAGRRHTELRASELEAAMDSALTQTQPLHHGDIRALIDRAKAVRDDEALAGRRRESLAAASTKLEERLTRQQQHAEQRLKQTQPKLVALSASLAEGELKRAEPLLQSLQSIVDLAEATGLPRQTYAEVLRQIQDAAPRIKELQGWRRWGADQKREALCQAVDELMERDESPEILTERLREVQAAWKALDQGGAPADRRRWERFHAAAERLYERCRPFLEQQAAEREANRRAREQVCTDLERFLDQVDWDRVDWKKAVKAAREMRRQWSAIGPTEGRQRRALEQRFRNAMRRLERRLDAERARNRRHREELIEEVERLITLSDIDRAIEETKTCQRRWQTTVAGRKTEENALWERFRSACDAVFARRRAQIEAREAALQDNLEARSAICAEAEALAKAAPSPEETETALLTLEQRWRDTASLPVPKEASSALSRRWREARAAVMAAQQRSRDRTRRAMLDLLARQGELCARLERRATGEAPEAVDLAAIEEEWAALPRHQDEALQAAIGARFATVLSTLAQRGTIAPETLAENHREREALCLQLEILAQVDSPPELANERLAFQVNRLTERMAAGEKDPLASAAGLLSKWYLCGPAPDAPDLEARFARVLAALRESGESRKDEQAA